MSDTLVCPECGHNTFTVARTTRTEYTVQWDSRAGEFELSSTLVDGGDAGDENDWTCDDCGTEYPDCNPDDDLTTAEAYNGEDEEDGPGCALCDGPLMPLGTLGTREHFRCRSCGLDQSPVDSPAEIG